MNTYGLVHTSTVQGLHGALGGTGIIILNKAVVVPLCLFTHRLAVCTIESPGSPARTGRTQKIGICN
jgi:hypothetical protein